LVEAAVVYRNFRQEEDPVVPPLPVDDDKEDGEEVVRGEEELFLFV
jgi:hypothetical protein